MKAIETEYSGVLFRSRLEARWAVFFDALGIRWEYEPEAYELSDGTRYLPDFLVLGGRYYVEIKPHDDPFTKARKFAIEAQHDVWLCAGEPRREPWTIVSRDAGRLATTACIYSPGKGRLWVWPSNEECVDFLSAAVGRVRAYRFWNPREAR